ncbi:hypothetical protein T11_8332 [Trichinella zimbabwensis]|uniref:Uncharacterized protein n=1 Tax=Trichinella zimbabwensis TaxID=268475 RepID=A0A0V1H3Y8_9BILA|nr:hypothetical protein T11_8332 [Trichinella zimbabwensis]
MRQTDQSKKIERVVCVVKNVNILISTPTLRTTHKKQQSKKVCDADLGYHELFRLLQTENCALFSTPVQSPYANKHSI